MNISISSSPRKDGGSRSLGGRTTAARPGTLRVATPPGGHSPPGEHGGTA